MIEKYWFKVAAAFTVYALVVAVGAIISESSDIGRDLTILAVVALILAHVALMHARRWRTTS